MINKECPFGSRFGANVTNLYCDAFDLFLALLQYIFEPPLGVIGEQGKWPLRPKGARSMV